MEEEKPEKPTKKFNFKKIFFITFVILIGIFILMIGGPGAPGGKTIIEKITKVLIVLFFIGLLSLVITWIAKVIALSPNYTNTRDEPPETKRESVEKETIGDVSQDTQQKQEKKELKLSKHNKLAITGFILSVVSILGIRLTGIIAFILGVVALVQIKYTKEKGKGLAIAAIIIGFIKSFVMSILEQLINLGF